MEFKLSNNSNLKNLKTFNINNFKPSFIQKYNYIKNKKTIPYKIGIIIPTTSKGKSWTTVEETYLWTHTIQSFLNTTNEYHYFVFYIGIDTDDPLWSKQENHIKLQNIKQNRKNIDFKFFLMKDIPKGYLTKMWNKLFRIAYNDNCNYFLQCGDDIVFHTKNWITDCIRMLLLHKNFGVTAPLCNNNRILTQSFVSRKHLEIFGCFFPEEIINWFCDDWINNVYQPNFYYPLFNHFCENCGGNPRYFTGTHSNSTNKNNQDTLNSQEEILYKMISLGRNKLFTYFNPKNNNYNKQIITNLNLFKY